MGLFSWFRKGKDAPPAAPARGGGQSFARTDARRLGDDPMPGWQPPADPGDDEDAPAAAASPAADGGAAVPPAAGGHPLEISCAEVALQLDVATNKRITLVDVRERWEFEARRLEGARHVPLSTLAARLDELAELAMQHDLVVVYCEHGFRSLDATLLLRREGIDQARSMSGGMAEWSASVGTRMARGPEA